jgi:hypothetical protein
VVGTEDTIVILCANYLIGSGFFLAELEQKWYPVCQLLFKDHILLLILARMCWHTGFQSAPLGIQIGIRCRAQVARMRLGFIKQKLNFKNSQELKGRSEKFKNQ